MLVGFLYDPLLGIIWLILQHVFVSTLNHAYEENNGCVSEILFTQVGAAYTDNSQRTAQQLSPSFVVT